MMYKDMSFDWLKLNDPKYLKYQAKEEANQVHIQRNMDTKKLDETPFTSNGEFVVKKYLLYDPHYNGIDNSGKLHPDILAWIDEMILRGKFIADTQKLASYQKQEPKKVQTVKKQPIKIQDEESSSGEEELKQDQYIPPPIKQAFVEPPKPKMLDAFKDIFKQQTKTVVSAKMLAAQKKEKETKEKKQKTK